MSGGQNIFASSVLIDDDGDPEDPVNLITQQLKANGNKREIYINGQDPLAGGGGGGNVLLAGGTVQAPQTFTGVNLFNNDLSCGAEFVSTVGANGNSFRGVKTRLTDSAEIGTIGIPEIKIDGRATSNRASGIQGDIEFSGALTGGVIGGTNEFRAQTDVPDGVGGFQCDVSLSGKVDALKELNSGTDVRAGVNGGNETVKLQGTTGKITCTGDIELLTSGANITGGATGIISGGDFRVGVGGTSNKVSIQPLNEDANNENARIHLGQATGSFSKLSIVKGKPNNQLTAGDTTCQFQQDDTTFPKTIVHPAFYSGGGIAYNWTNNCYKLNTTVAVTISNATILQNQTIMTMSATYDAGTGLYTPVAPPASSQFFDLYNNPPTPAGVGNSIYFPFTTRLDDGAGNIGNTPQQRFRIIIRQIQDTTSMGGFLATSEVISLANYPLPSMAGAVDSAGTTVGARDSYYQLEYSTRFCLFQPNANTFNDPAENSVCLARRSGYTTGNNRGFHQFFVIFTGFQNLPTGANVEAMTCEIEVVAVQ